MLAGLFYEIIHSFQDYLKQKHYISVEGLILLGETTQEIPWN